MVKECPQKWVWGAPAEKQKRLAPLLVGLEKLRDAGVTAATVATAFHKRSLLPLAQRRAFMFEMTRDVPWVGTRMLAEPVSASDIAARVAKTTHPELKNSRVVPMRPEKGYISLVRDYFFCFDFLRLFPFSACLNPFLCSPYRGWGSSGIPCPLSQRTRRPGPRIGPGTRSIKKVKEDKKAKAVRKAQRREISA